MTDKFLTPSQQLDSSGAVHLIGILGAGMSALAHLLLDAGWQVSGSDLRINSKLLPLRARGAQISIGSPTSDLKNVAWVIYSPAIPSAHPELLRSRILGLPTATRARALAALLQGREVIAVAGSHGKSTTTAMLAHLLAAAGQKPGFMLGELSTCLGGQNASWSATGPFVNESCEAFRALDFWNANHCIVTSLSDEHSDHYGTWNELESAFRKFVGRVPEGGRILLCADNAPLQLLRRDLGDRAEDFGFAASATWRCVIRSEDAHGIVFDLLHRSGASTAVFLPIPGRHNASNAVAAIAMASSFGISLDHASEAMSLFQSIPRRWQHIGQSSGVQIYDDIAHHPTEIAATLGLARRTAASGRSVIAVVQPQLQSRVTRLCREFIEALRIADAIVLLPLDRAGEEATTPDAGHLLLDLLREQEIPTWSAMGVEDACRKAAFLAELGDVVVTIGPGLAQECALRMPAALEFAEKNPHLPVPEEITRPTLLLSKTTPSRCLHDGWEHQARLHPNALCLIDSDRSWSYAEINKEANRVAFHLVERGISRDQLVVLCISKSARFIALVLGILKAGGAYLPIDPGMRRSNLNELLHRNAAALLIEEHGSNQALCIPIPTIEVNTFWQELKPSSQSCGLSSEIQRAHPGDLAYAIFTSGSTGSPKLVGVNHASASALIDYSTRQLFDPEDLALTPLTDSISFDACVHQIFATLSSGGCLLLERDLVSLLRSKHFANITNLGGTPTVLTKLIQTYNLPDMLRVISLGGEVIPQALLNHLYQHQNLKKIYNFYGPTETTIFSSVAEMLHGRKADGTESYQGSNIGFPVDGTIINLIDANEESVEEGKIGEIVISGLGLARGYLGDAAATAASFRTKEVRINSGPNRIYRTGDLGKRLADGSIEFIGRLDDQIKVNGVRIDPIEIESCLEACPGVQKAAVVQGNATGEQATLIAYAVVAEGTDLILIREQVAKQLPRVMVPKTIIKLDELPLTATGKLLRSKLREWSQERVEDTVSSIPYLDGVERRLISIWKAVLQQPDLCLHDNFFARGGDSLTTAQMVIMVEKSFGIRLPAHALETISTGEEMARYIREKLSAPESLQNPLADNTTQILDRQRTYLAAWNQGKGTQTGFVRCLGSQNRETGLYWCFQGYQEFRSLAHALGDEISLFGMRSGHLIMEYMPETIAALAQCYSAELNQRQPSGSFMLGGNCQGAIIARATALALRASGREVSRLLLMEQPLLWPYDQRVGLIYGRDSCHNPFLQHEHPEALFSQAYPAGYDLQFITGGHGKFFLSENVGSLALQIKSLISASPGATRKPELTPRSN